MSEQDEGRRPHGAGERRPPEDDVRRRREAEARARAAGRVRRTERRLFPGPTRGLTPEAVDRIRGLLTAQDSPPVAAGQLEKVHELLEQQNELLQAVLASAVDTQADARATAQNARTFAWAGIVIALLTLIATVVSIVAAVRA